MKDTDPIDPTLEALWKAAALALERGDRSVCGPLGDRFEELGHADLAGDVRDRFFIYSTTMRYLGRLGCDVESKGNIMRDWRKSIELTKSILILNTMELV